MASTNGTRTLMDWRDITERLLDPQQRRAIVTKTNTDDLQQMKTKNAFTKRKRRLLDQIRKNKNLNNTKNPDDKSPNTSPRESRCSELNFSNDDIPSTPPPTLPHTTAVFPSAPIRSNRHRSLVPPATARAASGSDSDTGPIDMGDYEHRIRPSSAFWRKKDGMSLAEKIIFYRNWKYRNFPRSEENHQTAGEMESTLTDYRRLRTTRQAAKSAATVRRRNSLEEEDRQRPVTVIPKVTSRVAFPPIDSTRQAVVTSSHGATSSHHDEEMDRLPAIEMNQYVARRSPLSRSEKVVGEDEPEEETDIDSGVQADEEEPVGGEEEEPTQEVEEEEKPTEEVAEEAEEVGDQGGAEEPGEDKGDAPSQDVRGNRFKRRRPKVRPAPGPRAPRPSGEPDKLIAKLNKKVERDLRTLQGQPNEDGDDDDDDTDVDDDTMNDILHGERGKALDQFLQQS